MAKLYEFQVGGIGEFPLDMLRYDQCWPKSESLDVKEIHSTFTVRERSRIWCVTLQSHKRPTEDRWRSFGWPVAWVETR